MNMRRKRKNKKIIPLNLKSLGNDISAYPFVEIEWLDIEGDAGWSTTKDLNKEKLPVCVSKGYLVSQKNGESITLTLVASLVILSLFLLILRIQLPLESENSRQLFVSSVILILLSISLLIYQYG